MRRKSIECGLRLQRKAILNDVLNVPAAIDTLQIDPNVALIRYSYECMPPGMGRTKPNCVPSSRSVQVRFPIWTRSYDYLSWCDAYVACENPPKHTTVHNILLTGHFTRFIPFQGVLTKKPRCFETLL